MFDYDSKPSNVHTIGLHSVKQTSEATIGSASLIIGSASLKPSEATIGSDTPGRRLVLVDYHNNQCDVMSCHVQVTVFELVHLGTGTRPHTSLMAPKWLDSSFDSSIDSRQKNKKQVFPFRIDVSKRRCGKTFDFKKSFKALEGKDNITANLRRISS